MARESPDDPDLKYCIYGEHWTRDWKYKQHYCDKHWNMYLRKQKYVRKHKVRLIPLQGGKCAICERPFDELRAGSIHVDHDHSEAFRIRGLLCINCNSLLGHARDRLDVLRKAIVYLEGPPGVPLDDLIKQLQLVDKPKIDYDGLFSDDES